MKHPSQMPVEYLYVIKTAQKDTLTRLPQHMYYIDEPTADSSLVVINGYIFDRDAFRSTLGVHGLVERHPDLQADPVAQIYPFGKRLKPCRYSVHICICFVSCVQRNSR